MALIIAHCVSCGDMCQFRKPKKLQLGQKVSRLGDLQPALLATVLARAMPFITEHTLFALGGELLEVFWLRFMFLRMLILSQKPETQLCRQKRLCIC